MSPRRVREPVRTDEARDAREALHDALEEHAASSVPCRRHPDLFTSDVAAERTRAAAMCQGCPVVLVCRSYSVRAREGWHVWGGRDRTGRKRERLDD